LQAEVSSQDGVSAANAQQTLPMTTNYHIMNEFDMTCAVGRAIAERSVSAGKGALKGP
jgi:hypothetical protein